MGDSYRLYLRDTDKKNEAHRDALQEASTAVMALVDATVTDVLPSIQEDLDQGDYTDIID